jgi:hypothetical protein
MAGRTQCVRACVCTLTHTHAQTFVCIHNIRAYQFAFNHTLAPAHHVLGVCEALEGRPQHAAPLAVDGPPHGLGQLRHEAQGLGPRAVGEHQM